MRTQKKFIWLLITALFMIAPLCLSGCRLSDNNSRNRTKIMTQSGWVRGDLDENDTVSWKGIPYAAPPVGDLRWKAPQDPERWSSVLETTEFCEPCLQSENGVILGNEDCLRLNIWRPRNDQRNLPVFFYIYGAWHAFGSPDKWYYDGANLAGDHNIVVVTIQFRTGILGWLTHSALRHGESADDDSGNFGTLDMIKALTWVQDNIQEFGGDPNNVTIAGQCAGAIDVLSLLVSPAASGLFHKAIAMSGALGGPVTSINSVEAGEDHADRLIASLLAKDGLTEVPGNDVEAYLRSKTGEDLLSLYTDPQDINDLDATLSGNFKAIFSDGAVIHENGASALYDPATYNQVPLILGSTAEEHKIFMCSDFVNYPTAQSYQSYAEILNSVFWKPLSTSNIANIISGLPGQPPVYVYEFDYGAYRYIYDGASGDIVPDPNGYSAWPTDFNGTNYALMLGAVHGLDIPFFFGNVDLNSNELYLVPIPFNMIVREDNLQGAQALSDAMTTYIAEFLYNGDPSDAGGILWEPWSSDPGAPKRIVFDANDTEAIIEMSDDDLTTTQVSILVDGAPFHGTNGLFFDSNDRLHIASVFHSAVIVMDPETGEVLEEFRSEDGVIGPDDVTISPDGTMYWTDLSIGEVGKRAPDGTITKQFVAMGVNPITLSDDGRLFVALDFFGDGLYELDPDLIQAPRLIIQTLGFLNAFDFGPDGYLYGPIWTMGKVVRIDVDTGDMITVNDDFGTPAAVKFNSEGQMYVGDNLRGEISRVDYQTGAKEVIATGLEGLDNIALDSQNRLFASNAENGSITEILSDGSKRIVSPGGMIFPGGVAVMPNAGDEAVYVGDLWYLREFDPQTGEQLSVNKHELMVPGVMAWPMTVAADDPNLILTCHYFSHVQVWNPNTRQIVEDYHDFINPINAIRFGDDLIVAELGLAAGEAKILRVTGSNRITLADVSDGVFSPAGLAATEDDLWLADQYSATVMQLIDDNQVLETPLIVATGLAGPEGLAVDTDGNLLVVEAGAGKLSKIDLSSGEVTLIADELELGALGAGVPTYNFNGVAVGAENIYVTGDKSNVLYKITR